MERRTIISRVCLKDVNEKRIAETTRRAFPPEREYDDHEDSDTHENEYVVVI